MRPFRTKKAFTPALSVRRRRSNGDRVRKLFEDKSPSTGTHFTHDRSAVGSNHLQQGNWAPALRQCEWRIEEGSGNGNVPWESPRSAIH
jgi:hypothetical protein